MARDFRTRREVRPKTVFDTPADSAAWCLMPPVTPERSEWPVMLASVTVEEADSTRPSTRQVRNSSTSNIILVKVMCANNNNLNLTQKIAIRVLRYSKVGVIRRHRNKVRTI